MAISDERDLDEPTAAMPVTEAMPAEPAAGWLLGERYRMTDRIGTGGMAEVFRARDELLTREVAVKLFRSSIDPADSAGGLQRQQVELHTLAQLSHPNLITLFDGRIAEAAGPSEHAYLVMELIDGPSLAARIADGPLPEPEVRVIAGQVCDALSYVHAKGMVHRDVKPANILLGSDGDTDATGGSSVRARLSDFGIVRLLDSAHLTSVDFMVGTAAYLSPEQAHGAEVGPAADIYALGLVLLEALTGQRTFPGTGMDAVIARLDGPPPIPAGLVEPWPELLRAMTLTDPQQRLTAAEVARVLRGTGILPVVGSADPTTVLAPVGLPISGTEALPMAAAAPVADQWAAAAPVADQEAPVADQWAAVGPPTGSDRPSRRGRWLPWLIGVLLLAAVLLILLPVLRGHSTDGPSHPAVTPSLSHTARTTSAPATSARPSTTASSAPTTSQPASSTPATTPASTPTTASSAPTSTAASTVASTPTSTGPASSPAVTNTSTGAAGSSTTATGSSSPAVGPGAGR